MTPQPATARILIVDDDEMVRYILQATLSGAGYHVVEAETGEAAVELCSQQTFALVLMDLFMPGLSGPEALEQIRERQPALRLVLLSGAPEELKDEVQLKGVRFFPKPFDTQELLQMVREELQASGLHP